MSRTHVTRFAFLLLFAGCAIPQGVTVSVVGPDKVLRVSADKTQTYQLPPDLRQPIGASQAPNGDFVIISEQRDAFLLASDFNGARQKIAENALGSAWSNDGRFVALLLASGADEPRHLVLDIRRSDGRDSWSLPLLLLEPQTQLGNLRRQWSFRISWSTDDDLIAVSTSSDGRGPSPRECALVNVPSRQYYYEPGLSDVCFVANRTIACTTDSRRFAPICAFDLDLSPRNITLSRKPWQLTEARIASSDPSAGILVVWTSPPTLVPEVYRSDGFLTFVSQDGDFLGRGSDVLAMNSIVCVENREEEARHNNSP